MDYEQKYKQALETIQEVLSSDADAIRIKTLKLRLQSVFPELAESEDDKIRKELIEHIKANKDADYVLFKKFSPDDVIAWLEKQGTTDSSVKCYSICQEPEEMRELLCEWDSDDSTWHEVAFYHSDNKTFWNGERQVENVTKWCYIDELFEKQGAQESVDKVEPKFKVGDWVVFIASKSIYQVEKIDNYEYTLRHILGGSFCLSFSDEKLIREWTINDAKDGDVLAFDDNTIVIFKDLYNATTFHSYCHIEDRLFNVSEDGAPHGWEGKGFYPATKEQRDLLFTKMKEAGYEWNAEKKELKMHEKQDEQKQTWKPSAAQLIVIKSLIEDKNTLNVSKVILQGMLDEFKQYFGL